MELAAIRLNLRPRARSRPDAFKGSQRIDVLDSWNVCCWSRETVTLSSDRTHCLRIFAFALALSAFAGEGSAAESPRYVFAHYMVCFATYGETVDGYKRDIRDAQAAGIDGFALNVGAWSGPDTYYKRRVQMIYDAAEQLGSGFKLFFSIEIADTNDIVDMISSYGSRANSFKHQGRVVVSTYGQNLVDWSGGVFAPLRAGGIDCFFVPHFWPDPVRELPGYQDAVNLLNTYSNVVDGLFLFGAAGLPSQLAQSNSNYTKAVHAAGKTSMASVTPHYWGSVQNSIGRRYIESDGGEGITLQWNSIITNQPDWVEIVTWNDWSESTYLSPVDDPGTYFAGAQNPRRYSHTGYLELSKRYIAWYKTGSEPAIDRDALFYFYRTHSKSAGSSKTNDTPVSWFIGDVQDVAYTTVCLVGPAQLEIRSGGIFSTNSLLAGISHVRTPFSPGLQKFTLRRNGGEVISAQGPAIQSDIEVYDYFPATGFAYHLVSPPLRVRVMPVE